MTGFPSFVSEKESGNGVQARMNDQQGRYGKVWDMVLSDYRKGRLDWIFVRWSAAIRFCYLKAFFGSFGTY